jgi:predicted nucleic acid-binding protein
MIIADTSVLIDFFKGKENEPARKLERLLQSKISIGITSVIYQEVLQGARTETELKTLKAYLETQLFYHPLDPKESYAAAARIYARCRKRGITVRSTIDCLIAQIALEHDLAVLHSDGDFDRIARVVGLKIY